MIRSFICCLMLLTTAANARWLTLEDAFFKVIDCNMYFSVSKDYKYEQTVEVLFEVLTEQARNAFSKYIIPYDLRKQKVEILQAYTLVGGKKYTVAKSAIEDKPLASKADEIAENAQVSIAFPKIMVGTKVYLKYKVINEKPNQPRYFGITFYPHDLEYIEKFDVRIDSEVPLYFYKNDPHHLLAISKQQQQQKFVNTIIINQQRPATDDLID